MSHIGLITETLEIDTLLEQFVEVEIMFHEEADVAGLELHGAIALNITVREYKNVEGSSHVGCLLFVKLEATKSYLECIGSLHSMRQLLIAVFDLVKGVNLVFFVYRQS